MKGYVQPGISVTLPAPYPVSSGNGLQVGALFGIALHDAVQGEETETLMTGVVDLTKAPAQAWAIGDRIYWDNTAKHATTVATDTLLIGVALRVVGNGADDTVGRVRLNGATT